MTIASSGPMRIGTSLANEYHGGIGNKPPRRLGDYRRGMPSLYVRKNSANNIAVNASAAVPITGALRMANFRGQGIGWTYTNTTQRIAPVPTYGHYYCHLEFGDDWSGANGTNWPCVYINNAVLGSTSTSYYPLVFSGRQNNGPCTFINNSEIQGAGGQTTSAVGQHACVVNNSENAVYANRPIIVNNGAFRGGGGAGGQGGTGGTGGQGYYNYGYTAYDPSDGSFVYANYSYEIMIVPGGAHGYSRVYWGGSLLYDSPAPPYYPITIGIYTYEAGNRMDAGGSTSDYSIRRNWAATGTTITNGGAGGGGGAGGRGIGWNSPNQGGAGGAPGAGGGTNAGSGGYGGTGGTGGTWGTAGDTGGTGAGGNWGNYQGWGPGGSGGTAGGAAGYSIWGSTKWGYTGNGTLNGPTGGGVGNS